MQPGGRSDPSVQWCRCYSAQPRAVGSPGLLCVSWRLDRWSWILGRVKRLLTKVFFIFWLPPVFLSVFSYRFGYRITRWGFVFSNCSVVFWSAVAIVSDPHLPVQVTFGHTLLDDQQAECVFWLRVYLST